MGIYIHIPFCKQACHYCDFHFSTSLKRKPELVDAICQEIQMRKTELSGPIKTIYFGGGTPSLLNRDELEGIINTIAANYEVSQTAEITLEANPDDLTADKLKQLSESKINRLSIGVQSFYDEDLKLMNRAHTQSEAIHSVQGAKKYFDNISIDLIYGIPGMSELRWRNNLDTFFQLELPHLSCYALTVEPKTALSRFIEKGIVPPVEDEVAQIHHAILLETTRENGYVNYEFSNFGRPGFESQNNLGYWFGKSYLGIGPSAHSYDGTSRSWNVSNNMQYIKSIEIGKLPLERELLSVRDRFNEYVMTRLRTQQGLIRQEVEELFGPLYWKHINEQGTTFVERGLLDKGVDSIRASDKGKFFIDGIASDLFLVHLKENQ